MIKYLKHTEIDKSRWDKCLEESLNAHIYVCSWYLDLVSPGWDALVEGDYEVIMPLAHRRKHGIRYLFVPFFVQQMGIIFSKKLKPGVEDDFLKLASKKFRYLDLYLNSSNEIQESLYEVVKRQNQFLSLAKGYDDIVKNYNRNLIRNLNNAELNGLEVKEQIDSALVINLFRKEQGQKLDMFNEKDYKVLKELIDFAGKLGKAENLGVYKNGELCATGCFFIHTNQIIFFKCSTTALGKEVSAMHFLVNYVIKKYSGRDYVFDFGGSSVPSVAQFNKNFGVQEEIYLHVKKNNLPKYIRWLKN